MSETAPDVRLINSFTRPVELHLASGVVVIPAHGDATCTAEDVDNAQVRVLIDQGVLVARTVEAQQASEANPARRGGRRGRAPS